MDVAFVHGAVNPVLSPLLPLLNNYALPLSAPLELYRQPLLPPLSHVIVDSHELALQYFGSWELERPVHALGGVKAELLVQL